MAVERAEHRSGTGGEEAHVSERSELCAVPLAREERREPAGAARRLAARPVLSLGYFSLHEQREVTRSCEAGVKALLFKLLLSSSSFQALPLDLPIGFPGYRLGTVLPASALAGLGEPKQGRKQNQELSLPLGTRATLTSHSAVEKAPLYSCKETWPKETRPCLRALRACGTPGPLRRYGRGSVSQSQGTTATATTASLQPTTTPKPDPRQGTARRPVASCTP